jgi:mRNA-degrading endonuclease RelE of RelBE toxin-antitoxin system
MRYEIKVKKAVLKNLRKLPMNVQDRFENIVQVLRQSGTDGAHIFQNFSKLGENEYHCHLTYHWGLLYNLR